MQSGIMLSNGKIGKWPVPLYGFRLTSGQASFFDFKYLFRVLAGSSPVLHLEVYSNGHRLIRFVADYEGKGENPSNFYFFWVT